MSEMLSLTAAAERLGISPASVKTMASEHKMLVVRRDEGLVVPAEALDGDVPVKHLSGVLHLLHDAGYDAEESFTWMTTEDASLPGTPFQALQENRATEVKRRAQALGF